MVTTRSLPPCTGRQPFGSPDGWTVGVAGVPPTPATEWLPSHRREHSPSRRAQQVTAPQPTRTAPRNTVVIASAAKQSSAGSGRPGLLRYARNDGPHALGLRVCHRRAAPGSPPGPADSPAAGRTTLRRGRRHALTSAPNDSRRAEANVPPEDARSRSPRPGPPAQPTRTAPRNTFVIASAAKQSRAGSGHPGLLRCARNDGPHALGLHPIAEKPPLAHLRDQRTPPRCRQNNSSSGLPTCPHLGTE